MDSDLVALHVDRLADALVESQRRVGAADVLEDGPVLYGAHRRSRQHRCEDKVVPRRDDADVADSQVHDLRQSMRGPARAQDHHAAPAHGRWRLRRRPLGGRPWLEDAVTGPGQPRPQPRQVDRGVLKRVERFLCGQREVVNQCATRQALATCRHPRPTAPQWSAPAADVQHGRAREQGPGRGGDGGRLADPVSRRCSCSWPRLHGLRWLPGASSAHLRPREQLLWRVRLHGASCKPWAPPAAGPPTGTGT
mmetsp:Transcript_43290/g.134035  ORF Transcript_43290/g.134035 Transcript_43290/m.134035 type:complete len:251 (+) Transcript_43290:1168-1920(+)